MVLMKGTTFVQDDQIPSNDAWAPHYKESPVELMKEFTTHVHRCTIAIQRYYSHTI